MRRSATSVERGHHFCFTMICLLGRRQPLREDFKWQRGIGPGRSEQGFSFPIPTEEGWAGEKARRWDTAALWRPLTWY